MKQVFDIENYNNATVMYCENEQEGAVFQEYLDSVGKCWKGGASYLAPDFAWSPNYPCYRFHAGTHGSWRYYTDSGYTILRFSDFDWDKTDDVVDEDNDALDTFLSSYCPLQEEVSQ